MKMYSWEFQQLYLQTVEFISENARRLWNISLIIVSNSFLTQLPLFSASKDALIS